MIPSRYSLPAVSVLVFAFFIEKNSGSLKLNLDIANQDSNNFGNSSGYGGQQQNYGNSSGYGRKLKLRLLQSEGYLTGPYSGNGYNGTGKENPYPKTNASGYDNSYSKTNASGYGKGISNYPDGDPDSDGYDGEDGYEREGYGQGGYGGKMYSQTGQYAKPSYGGGVFNMKRAHWKKYDHDYELDEYNKASYNAPEPSYGPGPYGAQNYGSAPQYPIGPSYPAVPINNRLFLNISNSNNNAAKYSGDPYSYAQPVNQNLRIKLKVLNKVMVRYPVYPAQGKPY